MPLYEDLVRRALEAQERAAALGVDAQRMRELSSSLRRAHSGEVLLRHCAWCERLELGGEWLHLEALGERQQLITDDLIRDSTHGVCPDCFERVSRAAEAARGARETERR